MPRIWKHGCTYIVSSASCGAVHTQLLSHILLQCIQYFLSSAYSSHFSSFIIPSFSCQRGGRYRQVVIKSMFSLFYHLSLSFFVLVLSKSSLSSLCVLPHGFSLQQCVALVITSCLKQTDGVRESDGQFSQCLFSLCMCTQLLFACVFCMHTTLLLSVSFRLPPHSPLSLSFCEFAVVHSWCVFVWVCM